MGLSARPDWARAASGIPVECVVCLQAEEAGGPADLTVSRNRLCILQPGTSQSSDGYDVSYVYGSEATRGDIMQRSLAPLLSKFVEGYNVTVIAFGSTGSGKTTLFEGLKGQDTIKDSCDGDGLVHLAADALFETLDKKAVAVGHDAAQKRRMPSVTGYQYCIDTSFTEIFAEACHDMYRKDADAHAGMPVLEDDMEGFQVSNLQHQLAGNAEEMRQSFNRGRAQRRQQATDRGSAQEQTAAIFCIHLAQFAPAASTGEEDRVLVSRLQFVDLPGSERLSMEPEILRLREGPLLNKGLLAVAALMRHLQDAGSANRAAYQDSVLTQLLADGLGGNSLTLMLATLRQGERDMSFTTMQYAKVAQACTQYPIINHGRSRGLLQKMRQRLLSVLSDRDTLRDQLQDVAADGDPNAAPFVLAKIRDLEAQLLQEREEKAALLDDKAALQIRVNKLRDANVGDLAETSELQTALVKSEEQRLEVSRMLIDLQMEFNDAQADWESAKYQLERRVAELEAAGQKSGARGAAGVYEAPGLAGSVEAHVMQEQAAEIAELQCEIDRVRGMDFMTRDATNDSRHEYQSQLQGFMRDISELSRQSTTGGGTNAADLCKTFQKLMEESARVTAAREAELRQDLDELQGRNAELKHMSKALTTANAELRCAVKEQGPATSSIVTKDAEQVDAAARDLLRSDDEATRRQLAKLHDQIAAQDQLLSALRTVQAAESAGVALAPRPISAARRHVDDLAPPAGTADVRTHGSSHEQLRETIALLEAQVRELSKGDPTRGRLATEVSRVTAENEQLRRHQGAAGASSSKPASVHQQLQDFTQGALMELERRAHALQSRAVMAEEQLLQLQDYITQASITYQREIMRLRAVVGQLDPAGTALRWNAATAKA